MSNIVEITKGAEDYLGNLLKDSEDKDTNIRIFVSDPGSNRAETCIVYCKPGEQEPTDFSQSYEFFSVFLDEKSLPYLEDAKVDYNPDKFGGQLTIRAPKSKTPFLSDESSIEDSPYKPSSPSSASKASADHLIKSYVRTYKLDAVVSNCCNNFGPGQFPEK